MKPQNFIIVEVLCIVTFINALFVLTDFVKARDGELRKIMIAYFAIESWVMGSAFVYIWMTFYGYYPVRIGIYLMSIIIPKFVVKTWLRRWQIKQKQ